MSLTREFNTTMSVSGTFETCRRTLSMSGVGVRTEVATGHPLVQIQRARLLVVSPLGGRFS